QDRALGCFDLDKTVERIANGRGPCGSAILTFGVDTDRGVLLHLKSAKDATVLYGSQFLPRNAALSEVATRLEQLRRPKQATDVVSTELSLHCDPHRLLDRFSPATVRNTRCSVAKE